MNRPILARAFVAFLLAATALAGLAQDKAPSTEFVIGTTRPEGTPVGQYLRRVYIEAFRRLDRPVRFEVQPVKRLRTSLAEGQIDAETARPADFAVDLPEVIRVDEPIMQAVFAVYVLDPQLRARQVGDLRDMPLRGAYPRGVVECERALVALLPPDRLLEVPLTEHALRMLVSGRADFVCAMDSVLLSAAQDAEFRGAPRLQKLVEVASPLPLYMHVHRRHAELVPRLARVLKDMRTEGLLDRYRAETLH